MLALSAIGIQAKVEVPDAKINVQAKPKFKSFKPQCPRGYTYNNGTCVQYTRLICRRTGCGWNANLGRCNGPNCQTTKACPTNYEPIPVLVDGHYLCRRTVTPTCPAGSTWDPMQRKCKPQELNVPR